MEDFCPECESILYPLKKRGKEILKCKRCGYSKVVEGSTAENSFRITTEFKHSEKDRIEIIRDGDLNTMPTTRAECPKCGHMDAAYWQLQTRSADEGMTTFYRCLECKYTWRAY